MDPLQPFLDGLSSGAERVRAFTCPLLLGSFHPVNLRVIADCTYTLLNLAVFSPFPSIASRRIFRPFPCYARPLVALRRLAPVLPLPPFIPVQPV